MTRRETSAGDDSEETPLLDAASPAPSSQAARTKAASLIIPVAILCRLAILIPSTTTYHVIHQFVCRLWYLANDPDGIPTDGRLPTAMCGLPAVERNYSSAITAMGVVDGLGSMAAYASLSFFASRFGRKPAILAVLAAGLVADFAMILSNSLHPRLQLPFLVLWLISEAVSQPPIVVFVTNMYLVDLVSAETRTAALSVLWGWASLGSALSFTLGGTITTRADNVQPVYFVAAAIWSSVLIYSWAFLPESFPKARREELRREREDQARTAVLAHPEDAKPWAVQHKLAVFFEPLQQLKPRHDPVTGRSNWRLVYCAVHIFFAEIGGAYAVSALVIHLTSHYDYTPQDTGYALTTLNLSNVFVLTVVIPLLVRFLTPLYKRRQPEPQHEPTHNAQVVTGATDHLDAHLVIVSWIIEAAAYILVAYMTTQATQLTAIMLVGCSAGRAPVFRSLVVASVHPLKQGQTLAAIEMVGSVGMFLSPLVMGSILIASISTLPQLVFFVQAVIVISASFVLFLVRDVDRYQAEPEAECEPDLNPQ
ncbi:MFS general substrate transporter [Mycena belliarum]|uniref:MFS general substrate transporter n=1 Tax=Mycena belliarum TaxID=1033014 RepID=A0AAD6UIB5_9AGAR|nr:MFS general substrate transporter [Mycena belliae]